MGRNSNRSSYGWLVGAAVIVLLSGLFGGLGSLLLLGGLIFGGIVLLVALVVIIALKGSADDTRSRAADGTRLDPEDAAILSKARRDLTDLRMLATRIEDGRVREMLAASCGTVERIISTVKEQPEEIRNAQLYFQYYLPTQRDLMRKYTQMEKNGVATEEIRQKILKYLMEIKSTSDAQLAGLFEDDITDINAELEMMRRDAETNGLL